MSKNLLFPAQSTQPEQKKPFSSSILIVEAAIATLVLSVFVSSSPKLFTAQAPTLRPMTAVKSNQPQQQLFSIHFPYGAPIPLQVKEADRVN